jgi:hypothetical protein
MALTMRPTGLGSGAYKDNVDYNIFSGEWLIGRIYERCNVSDRPSGRVLAQANWNHGQCPGRNGRRDEIRRHAL